MARGRLSNGVLGMMLLCLFLSPVLIGAKAIPFKGDRPRLIEPGELAGLTDHPSLRVIDMRSSLVDYLKGHIPDSVFLSCEVLRIPKNGIPAQAPDRIYIEKVLGEYLSISNDMWVVLYGERSNPNATCLAWTLAHLGHKKVAVLNGGWEKWVSEKLPTIQEYPVLSPKKFFGRALRETTAEKKWVRDRLGDRGVVIVDARSPREYTGEEGEEIRRGHIPGARNIFWETTLEGDEIRAWKKKEELEKIFLESGITKDKEVVVYSGIGQEGSHLYFTLRYVLGFPRVRLYRGAWVEWSADKSLPVKTGLEP